jgi:hypothetical protein
MGRFVTKLDIMIQRIQSLFLMIAFDLQIAMLFFPLSNFQMNNNTSAVLYAAGLKSGNASLDSLYSSTFIFVIICITVLLPMITIFLYKRRSVQMRFCLINVLLLIGLQAFLFWYVWNTGRQLEVVTHYKITLAIPVISAILSYLAYRFIRRDERLIRSIDRIR